MQLTRENFLEHYDRNKPFWMAHQKSVERCDPIIYDTYTKKRGYQCYAVGNRIERFSRKHLILSTFYDVFNTGVFTTREEALIQMRVLFLELIDHYNKHEFKEFPIEIIKL